MQEARDRGFRTGLASIVCLLLLVGILSGCGTEAPDLDLSMYQYRDTRNLVQFVYQAAERVRREGHAAIEYFSKHRSQYLTPDYYL